VKAVDKESEGFAYLRQKFRKKSEAKIKKMGFRWSTSYTTIRRPRLQYKIKFHIKKSLEGIWKRQHKFYGARKSGKQVKLCRIYFHQTVLLV